MRVRLAVIALSASASAALADDIAIVVKSTKQAKHDTSDITLAVTNNESQPRDVSVSCTVLSASGVMLDIGHSTFIALAPGETGYDQQSVQAPDTGGVASVSCRTDIDEPFSNDPDWSPR